MISIINILLLGFQLFAPTVRLNSGKQISLVGTGPPVVFSSGLFNTMPRQLYNNLIDQLKDNVTIVSINDFTPLSKNDINDIVTALNVDSVSYISHSSFNPDVLESNKINKAVLIDPICIPKVNLGGFNQLDVNKVNISPNFPVMVIKAEKLYDSVKSLPEWQDPHINGIVYSEIVPNVGHPDILDDIWADVAKQIGLWDTAQGTVVDFKEWKFVKNNDIKEIRKKYRELISKKSLEFINNDISSEIVITDLITSEYTPISCENDN